LAPDSHLEQKKGGIENGGGGSTRGKLFAKKIKKTKATNDLRKMGKGLRTGSSRTAEMLVPGKWGRTRKRILKDTLANGEGVPGLFTATPGSQKTERPEEKG